MSTALGKRLGDLGPELRLRRPRKWRATRPQGTDVDRGWPLHLARLWHEAEPTTTSHDGVCQAEGPHGPLGPVLGAGPVDLPARVPWTASGPLPNILDRRCFMASARPQASQTPTSPRSLVGSARCAGLRTGEARAMKPFVPKNVEQALHAHPPSKCDATRRCRSLWWSRALCGQSRNR